MPGRFELTVADFLLAISQSPSFNSIARRAQIAVETLQKSGFNSVASLVDALLQDNALDYADCHQIALAIL